MLTTLSILVILCALIWLIIIVQQINHRGFLVLLIWLIIAPIATNVLNGRANPFFLSEEAHQRVVEWRASLGRAGTPYKVDPQTINVRDLLSPTRTLFGAFLCVLLVNALLRKQRLVPLDRTEIWMGIFSLILLASALLQSNRLGHGLRVATDGFIIPFLGYYITRRLVINENRFRQLSQVLGYLGFYIIIICLMERLAHSQLLYRLSGPFGYPDALYIVLTVAFYAVVLDEKSTLPHSIRSFVLYMTPVIIFLTFARQNWVAFLSGVWIFLFLGYRLINHSHKMARIGLALLAPLIVIGALAVSPEEVIRRAGAPGTVNWRFERWKVAIDEGAESPVYGIGLNNLRDALGRRDMNYATAHNSVLTIFAEHGVIGLLAYLAIVISIIQMGLRLYRTGLYPQDRWRGIVVIAVLVSQLVFSLYANALHASDIRNVYVYVFLGGIAGLYSRHPSAVSDGSKKPTSVSKTLTPARV